jgi:hypothetical protein
MADLTVRQLVIAKSLDNVSLSLGHVTLYPFIIQPTVTGTSSINVPNRWIWDMHASLPAKWEQLRLAKIKRVSGENSGTNGYSGALRCIFTANVSGSSTETAIFSAEYTIDSDLSYQTMRLTVVDSTEESVPIDPSEAATANGFLIFRTLDVAEQDTLDFFDIVAPPTVTTDTNGDGYFDTPAIYEVADSAAGGASVTDDFGTSALSHGSGLLTDSAWNSIPNLDTDIQSWISAFNYPFDSSATRTSTDSIVIPLALFREFDITAPAGDQPTGDTSGLYYPVWVSRIERIDSSSDQLRFYFATYNVTDTESGGTPSTTAVEFASMDLLREYTGGEIVEITPIENLQLETGSDADYFGQHFGRGHAICSTLWNRTTSEVDDFFDAFALIVDSPPDTQFTQASTRLSSYGISRVPKYVPTVGQSYALIGSTARRTTPVNPGYDNRYVTEQDQGLGNQVDLEAVSGINAHTAIERYGYGGALTHKIVRLVVDATSVGDDPDFYTDEILPRLRELFGRNPQFGDFWHNGTRLMFHNGDSWQG